jgi:hypothetical protein
MVFRFRDVILGFFPFENFPTATKNLNFSDYTDSDRRNLGHVH